jgi:hypothetical protein
VGIAQAIGKRRDKRGTIFSGLISLLVGVADIHIGDDISEGAWIAHWVTVASVEQVNQLIAAAADWSPVKIDRYTGFNDASKVLGDGGESRRIVVKFVFLKCGSRSLTKSKA